MKPWFLQRSCSEEVVGKQKNKVKSNFNSAREVRNEQVEGVPLVVTYHPSVGRSNKIIIDKLHLLYVDKEVKAKFPIRPMVSFRGARKFSSYLVRAEIYYVERKVRSCRCNKRRYKVCVSVNETHKFFFSRDSGNLQISHKLNYDDKCLIYLLTC